MTILCLALALCADTHPWSGWKEGTTVTLRTTTVTGASKLIKEETWTVLKVEGTTVTLKIDVDDRGQKSSRQETVNAVETPVKYGGTEKGKDNLTLDGVKLACKIFVEEAFEGSSKFAGQRVVTTRWICADAPTPGGLVKEERSGVQAAVTARDSSFKLTRLKESVKVKDRTFACWATEKVSTEPGQKTTERIWRSKEMPGWLVKAETKTEANGATTVTTTEITAFDVKK